MPIDPQAAADAARAWLALEPQLAGHSYATPAADPNAAGDTSAAGDGDNVAAAWQWATGAGVSVALLDDGFDVAGSEASFDLAASRSFASGSVGGSGAVAVAEGSGEVHGTTTAGDLAASGSGPSGVAPGATLVGVKESFGADTDPSLLAAGLTYAAGVAAVVNNSWGVTGLGVDSTANPAFAAWFAAVGSAVADGRGGLGTAIVVAAGNDRASGSDLGLHGIPDDPRVIAVAGLEPGGAVAPFSTPGAGLLVAATATGVLTTAPGTPGAQVAVSAGTSYAAPEVSGIIAMMLQANPALGWRDVQQILADSAYLPTGAGSTDGGVAAAGVVVNAATDWNGGGMHFSDDIGFGAVDADTAVSLARAWTLQSDDADLLTATAASQGAPTPLAGGVAQGSLTLGADISLQHVQVSVDAPGVSLAGLTLVLVSPSGTRSVLLQDAGSAGATGAAGAAGGLMLPDTAITSNAFWGEPSAGQWTLLLQDADGADAGTLQDWTLTAWGDAAGPQPLVFTPEFAALAAADPARTQVGGDGATTIDVAGAMTGATALDLEGGAGLLDGVAVQVAGGLRVASFAGDTAPVSVVAPPGGSATITGGDGPTALLGGAGDDTLVAGAGQSTIVTGAGASLVDLAAHAAGAPADTVVLHGQDTLLAGSGTVAAQSAAGAQALVFQQGATLSFTAGAGADTVVGGTAPATVYGGAGALTLFTGGGDTFVGSPGVGGPGVGGPGVGGPGIGGPGPTTVVGRGADTIWATAGGSFYAGPDSTVQLSGGAAVITAGAGSLVSVTGAAAALVVAGGGNDTLDGSGSTGSQVIYAGSGADLVRGGAGDDILVLGTGAASLSGGGGANLFVAVAGAAGGSDVITDFRPGTDQLVLQGYGAGAAAQALGTAREAGGSTQVSLSDGTQLSFLGVTGLGAGSIVAG